MMVNVTMVEVEIRQAISEYIANRYGVSLDPKQLNILVKSKQNFKSEWETADIKVDATCHEVSRA